MHRTSNGTAVHSYSATVADMAFTVLCRLVGLFAGTCLCILGVCTALMPYISSDAEIALMQSAIGAVLFLGGLMLARSGQEMSSASEDEGFF